MGTFKAHYLIFICITLSLMIPALSHGAESNPQYDGVEKHVNIGDTGPVAVALQLFRKTISRADGRRCMMYPSCSHYSSQALKRHGFIKGWVMTSDRLLRCGRDEKHIAEQIIIDNHVYVFDPLQQNDFWWRRP